MKNIAFIFLIAAIAACGEKKEPEKAQEKAADNNLLWSENIQTILPLEQNTFVFWAGSDTTNAGASFDQEKIFLSIKKALRSEKIKAYADYPNKELTTVEVEHILVQWDSTAQVEDPNNPGSFVSAPLKMEVYDIPKLYFHETIELDTLTGVLSKRVNYITLYTSKRTENGETVGTIKLFDVKFNEEKK